MNETLLALLLALPLPAGALPPVCRADCDRFPDLAHCRRHRDAWQSHAEWLRGHRLVTQGDYRPALEGRIEAAGFMANFWESLWTAGSGTWCPGLDTANMEFVRNAVGADNYYRGWTPDWLPPPGEPPAPRPGPQ